MPKRDYTPEELKALLKPKKRAKKDYKPLVLQMCKAHGLPFPEFEAAFHADRRWRFDMAWYLTLLSGVPNVKLAVEVQGGLFIQGRHTRGAALLKEYEKLNVAACLGWRVLFVTHKQLKSGEAFVLIKRALGL